jgi:cell division protein FtsA|tara:strand:+ start:1 stop:1197 length:1197 start_codon:yes stop_codon:yes gene_type:complete
MKIYSPILFIEINKTEYIFLVRDEDESSQSKIIYEKTMPIKGVENYKITDFDLAHNTIKENVYLIEQKLNFIFKDVILIVDNFNCSFINLTGFKKLNGSQILKENITFILNTLKSNIDEFEKEKTILHIFNSNYCLDKKKIENLPIGLFGDFYSHELCFSLMKNNDFKNLSNIFKNCNLKIRKILLKSFVEGSYLSDKNKNLNTFFKLQINDDSSQILYFENDALKFEQNFNFGTNLIINDISKITSLSKDIIKKIIQNSKFNQGISDKELIEKELFGNENYRKIKKNLVYDIAAARIHELIEIFILNNVNFISYEKKNIMLFLKIDNKFHFECFRNVYEIFLAKKNNLKFQLTESLKTIDLVNAANNLSNYGWKKEAVPVIHAKKSIIQRVFDTIFD